MALLRAGLFWRQQPSVTGVCWWSKHRRYFRAARQCKKKMRWPGIEPGSHPWQGCMIPLHHQRRFLSWWPVGAYLYRFGHGMFRVFGRFDSGRERGKKKGKRPTAPLRHGAWTGRCRCGHARTAGRVCWPVEFLSPRRHAARWYGVAENDCTQPAVNQATGLQSKYPETAIVSSTS